MIRPISNNKTLGVSPIKVPHKSSVSYKGANYLDLPYVKSPIVQDKFVRKTNRVIK